MTEPPSNEWRPDRIAVVFMNLGGLLLLLLGLTGYTVLWSAATGGMGFSIGGAELLLGLAVMLVLTAVLLIAHEGIHGLAIKLYGGSPEFGTTMVGKAIPAFYCTAPGTHFTKRQFLIIALAPLVLLGLGTTLAVSLLPGGGWLVAPAAVHLAGCVGDMTLAWIAVRQPRGTMIEDLKDGMRFHA